MSVPSTWPVLQAYSENNKPCNHWLRLPLSTGFILCTLFKYLQDYAFLIYLWLLLATSCTGISKLSWIFLHITGKSPSASTTVVFGIPIGKKKFPTAHRVALYDVISFYPISAPSPNHVIQSKHVRIL